MTEMRANFAHDGLGIDYIYYAISVYIIDGRNMASMSILRHSDMKMSVNEIVENFPMHRHGMSLMKSRDSTNCEHLQDKCKRFA